MSEGKRGIKKGLRARGTETQLGKKLIWPPKILPSKWKRGHFAAMPMLSSNTTPAA
ncbi:MAG: hypothetical protein JW947_10090 [Sedimentisphaerales bacterium]|nr:hypothetical protein [Sedimentisphaerales bacterium]